MISSEERDGILALTGALLPSVASAAPAVAQTIPRQFISSATMALTTGTMVLVGIYLPKGQLITNINALSGTTAAASSTHCWFALYDNVLNLLRQTTDDTAASPWNASVNKQLALTSTFTTTYGGLHYVAICSVATTTPTLAAFANIASGGLAIAPILSGTSTGSLTAAAPAAAAALTAIANIPYAYVS